LFLSFAFSIAVSVDLIFDATSFDYFWANSSYFSIRALFFFASSASFFNGVRSGSETT
jgi:hypothetical protein